MSGATRRSWRPSLGAGARGSLEQPSRYAAAAALTLAIGLCLALATPARPATNSFSYYGGPVMHSMNVVLVEWDPSTWDATTTAGAAADQGLVSYIAQQSDTTADPFSSLAEYTDATGDVAPVVTSGGTFQIQQNAGGPAPPVVSESQVQDELQSAIAAGQLPTPAGGGLSTAYFVLFGPNTSVVSQQAGTPDGDPGWCSQEGDAQVSNASPHILFALLPDPAATRRCAQDGQTSPTVQLTHAWASLETSPLQAATPTSGPPTGWYGSSGGVADACDGDTASDGPYTVQTVWSARAGACVGSGASLFAAPSVSITVPSQVQSGAAITFTGDAASTNSTDANDYGGHDYAISAGIASWQWNFGDYGANATASGPTAVHTFGTPGAYTVSLTVTDALGFTTSTFSQVVVTAPPPPPISSPITTTTSTTTTSTTSSGACAADASNCQTCSGGACGAKKPQPVAHASVVSWGRASVSSLGPGMGLLFTGGEAVSCPRGHVVCVAEFKLNGAGMMLAEGTLTLGQGRKVVLRAALTSPAQKLLARRGSLAATLTVVVSRSTDAPVSSTSVVTLTDPGHRRG